MDGAEWSIIGNRLCQVQQKMADTEWSVVVDQRLSIVVVQRLSAAVDERLSIVVGSV